MNKNNKEAQHYINIILVIKVFTLVSYSLAYKLIFSFS